MRIAIDLDLPQLERVFAGMLPAGIQLRGLQIDSQRMRADLQAPMVGKCTLVARVESRSGGLTLSAFDLEGAGLAKGMALSTLRRKIGELDQRRGVMRMWGESDGERLQLAWDN